MNDILEPDNETLLHDRVTLADILDAIEGDGAWMTREERLNAPVALVEAELLEDEWADFAIDEGGLLAAMRAGAASKDGLDPGTGPIATYVPRTLMLDALARAVRADPCLMLTGHCGAGKSHIVASLLRDPSFRCQFPQVIHVDCAALRMANAVMLGRDAVWAHFGSDDEGYKRFLSDLSVDERQCNALTALMESRLQGGGLIVLDHAEKLSASNEIDLWLSEQFLPRAAQLGAHVLLVHSTPVTHFRSALRDRATIDVPPITPAEVSEWLGLPDMARWHDLPVRAIAHFTGGRPPLMHDLGLYLRRNEQLGPQGALRAFVKWRSHDNQFISDCEMIIRAARGFPEVIERVLAPGGLASPWPVEGLPALGITALLASGGVRFDAGGRLALVSPLYVHRLRRLSRPDALAALAVRTDFHQIETTSSWKTLRRFGELSSDALAKSLGYESSPGVGLQRLITFLLRWEFRAAIFVRDPDNVRLWAPFDKPKQVGPLECWRQPDFARAAQTGQVVRADDGRVFVPVISYAGNATMVIVLEPVPEYTRGPCTLRVDIERVTGMIEGIQPTLAQLVQRMTLRRDRKLNGKLWYKSKLDQSPSIQHNLLRDVGCRSIVVLEVQSDDDGQPTWLVSRFQRTGGHDEGTRWTEGLSVSRLNAIVRHPSRRGLVLSGEAAVEAFPRLANRDVTLFCHPVVRDGGNAIVVFLFGGEGSALDGHLQTRLSNYAPEMLKAA